MRQILYPLLLATLAYTLVNLCCLGADRLGTTEIVGDSAFTSASSVVSGFEQKGPRSLFVSDASQFDNESAVTVVVKQPALVAAADEFRSCVGLGPFENVISTRGFAQRLKAMGYTVEMTAVDTRTGESDYRVVMPPLSSQQEAFRKLRELKSRGIESFVITKGLDAQGLTLGVFSSNRQAEDYRQTLTALGYDVILDVLPRVNRGYWVQITEGMFPEELLLDVAAAFIDVEVTETGCMN